MAYSTNTHIEATSLSHVTSIATNPPHQLDSPTDIPTLPLVLYIARVPGSRDVFLTPIKPREKIVTAEDVQSSLYFVHVNCEDDFETAPRRRSSVNTDASNLLSIPEHGIQRKPALPDRPTAPLTPPYPTEDKFPSIPRRPLSIQRKPIARKPVGSAPEHRLEGQIRNLDLPSSPPRPLPSPPVEDQPYNASWHSHNVRLLPRSGHSDENNPYMRQVDQPQSPVDSTLLTQPGSLTLIRRDPASNEQWDVACVHDPPIHEVSSAALLNPNAARRVKRGGAPLYLDVSNPAYAQFIGDDRPIPRTSTSSSNSSESNPPPEGIFRRRLYMPGSKYGEHNYGHQRRFSAMSSADHSDDITMPRTMRHSVDMSSSSSPAVADRRGKGYSFRSPWNGHCEFSTGATGKSLKCKHYLPSHHGGIMHEVSELRFNLPTRSSKTATALSEKRSSYFHRLHGRGEAGDEAPSHLFGEDGKLDLTLGRETAGGGFGGKQAKLGKLIVEPEGLKMLDLLVAANVGLWWRAYDKL